MGEPLPYRLDLSEVVRLNDDDLLKICQANPDLYIERNADGRLEIMSPAGPTSSARSAAIVGALDQWNRESGSPGTVFGADAGFILPNAAMRAPDAAWIRNDRWDPVAAEVGDKFAPIVPDFLAEVRSSSDRIRILRRKMEEWIENGCCMAWLVDPFENEVHVYRRDGTHDVRGWIDTLFGEDVLPGFTFDPQTLP